MKTLLHFYFFLLFSRLVASPFEEIEDLSQLPLLNPDFKERKTAKIQLSNGLKLFLISDPKADQSAAAVSVEVGSWSDPPEYPGMAHFCEHLLFHGTKKYPVKNEFGALLADFGGQTNASTGDERTIYVFSSMEKGFLSLLERFGHFFIDPLFDPSNVSREMYAVDQESAKSCESDPWRALMVWKETGNPHHPNRLFSCGNSKTLSQIPNSALKKWHRRHYGANRMCAVLYSSLPLKTLQEKAIALFSEVPKTNFSGVDPAQRLTSEKQRGAITYIKPVQTSRTLLLSWELPLSFANEPSHSAKLLSYALDRGHKRSLCEKLKGEGLIDTMKVEVNEDAGKDHPFFQMSFELTQKGVEEFQTIALLSFEALATFRSMGIPPYLHEEKNEVAELNYQYQSRQDAFTTVHNIGRTLLDEPLATYPRGQLLASEYSPEKIEALFSFLAKPEECALTLLAPLEKKENISFDKREKWYDAEYVLSPIPPAWRASWAVAASNSEICLPEPNPFLPKELHIVAEEALSPSPVLLAKGEFGTAYFARCPEFEAPDTSLHLHLLSPVLQPNPKSQVLASLYLDHLTDLLHPTLAAAADANLHASFALERSRLHLHLFGFSEKAPLLLQEILREMPLHPPTQSQFALYVERHQKEYANAQKELAYRQGQELLFSLLNRDLTSSREKLAALSSISYEEFLNFHEKLFETTYLEALFAGNLTLKEAESAWLDILHTFSKTPYPREKHPQTEVLHLPAQEGPFSLSQSTEMQGNASLLAIEEGPFTFEKRGAQEILGSAMREAFFNELRTKQKTGYIAFTSPQELEGEFFKIFGVHSSSHQPEDLLYRFELFLEEYLQNFSENISPERFETLKQSAISSLKTRFRNLKEKSALWDLLAFPLKGDFHFIEKRIQGLEALHYERFSQYAHEFLSRENRKRLAIFVQGKLPSPFAFEPITPNLLGEIAEYAPRKEEASPEGKTVSTEKERAIHKPEG